MKSKQFHPALGLLVICPALVAAPVAAQDATPAATPVATPSSAVNPLQDLTPEAPQLPVTPGVESPAGVVSPSDVQVTPSASEIAPPPAVGESLADRRRSESAKVPPISLVDAVVLALQNNPQREAAEAALRAAEARIGIARSAGGLQVGLNGSANYRRYFGSGRDGGGNGAVVPGGNGAGGVVTVGGGNSSSNWTESLGLDAQYPIYTGGRVKASKRQAAALAGAQAAQTLQVEQDLVQSTITAYLNVLRNQQLLEAAESNVQVSTERRRVAGVRYDAGAAARLEVLTANTQLAQAQQQRIAASNNLAQAQAALNILFNRPPETPLNIEPVAALTPRVPIPAGITAPLDAAPPAAAPPAAPALDTSAALRQIADSANPTLAAQRLQVEAAQANIDVAKSAKKPSLGLSLSGLLTNPISYAGRFLVSLGLSAAQSLFDSGRASSQVREARALAEQASDNLDTQRLNVAVQIESSLLTLDSAQKRLESADAAVIEAREALRAAQLGYEAGARTSLDVTDAQNTLLAAQTEAANARFDVANAQANLSAAVGVLTAEGQEAYQRALAERTQAETVRLQEAQAKAPEKHKKFLGLF